MRPERKPHTHYAFTCAFLHIAGAPCGMQRPHDIHTGRMFSFETLPTRATFAEFFSVWLNGSMPNTAQNALGHFFLQPR